MVDKVVTAVITTGPAVQDATSKESATSKPKKPHTKATHPRSSDMVNAAIGNLKERGGSSLQAIKKYIFSTYKIDAEKFAPFIKRYLKSAVATGNLIQTKGKGVSGSFKLPNKPVAPQPKGKRATRAVTAAKKVSIAKKSIASKKVAASKKIDAKKPVKRISNKKVSVKKSTAGVVLKKQKVTKTGTKTIPKTAKKAVKVSSAKLKSPKPKKVAPLKTAKFASKKK